MGRGRVWTAVLIMSCRRYAGGLHFHNFQAREGGKEGERGRVSDWVSVWLRDFSPRDEEHQHRKNDEELAEPLLECDENRLDPRESPDLCNGPKDTEKSEGAQRHALYAESE
jgi:hypothetical protein